MPRLSALRPTAACLWLAAAGVLLATAAAGAEPSAGPTASPTAGQAHSPRTAARQLLDLGRYAEAASAAAEQLARLGSEAAPELRAEPTEVLAEAKKHVATVVLLAPKGSMLWLDGVAIGAAPRSVALYLVPGSHNFRGRLGEAELSPVTTDLAAGKTSAVTLRAQVFVAPPSKPLWPALVLGGLSVAGLGAGLGLVVSSLQSEDEATLKAANIETCNLDAPDRGCRELASLVSERNTLQNAGVVSMLVGGVAGLSAVAYLLIDLPTESPETALRLAPLLGPAHAGLSLQGSFQ